MKIVIAGLEPPDQIGSWSGTSFHLSSELRERFEVFFVGGMEGPHTVIHRAIAKIHKVLKLRSYRIRSEPAVLREFAARMEKVIARESPDAVVSFGCEPLAYLAEGIPAYLIHDATFRQISGIYPHFQGLCKRSQRTGEIAQRRGLTRATVAIAASRWAAESDVRDYGASSSMIEIIPMGANLRDAPDAREAQAAIEQRLGSKTVRFLFVGVDWIRKGGDTAVDILCALRAHGIDLKLDIVGCTPPANIASMPFISAHGFLSKNVPDEARRLRALFREAHFFIMPSIAECYGCVFCEASAFGVPSISRAIGGIPDIIRNGDTGLLLTEDAGLGTIIGSLVNLCSDRECYRAMATRARSDFESRLNWSVYVDRLSAVMLRLANS